jgi:phosphotriesterase-related protein
VYAEIDSMQPNWQYGYIHNGVLPGLRERGVTDDQIEQILVRNRREFFAQQGAPVTPAEEVASSGG